MTNWIVVAQESLEHSGASFRRWCDWNNIDPPAEATRIDLVRTTNGDIRRYQVSLQWICKSAPDSSTTHGE